MKSTKVEIDRHAICRAAVERYGRIHQIVKAVEELGELQQALARWLNGDKAFVNICEEIADVEIMLEQLKIILGEDYAKAIKYYRDGKLRRLERRLVQDEGEEGEDVGIEG